MEKIIPELLKLETIIPKLLKKLKDSYESKNSLSINQRRRLCNSIVDYFERKNIKFSSYTMAELAEQIVEHFPTEDKVFSKNNKILKAHTFFKDLFANSRRTPGAIVTVPKHAVAFLTVFATHVKEPPKKPTIHPLQKLPLTLTQVRMKMMKKNL